jgi:hypothetical protein
MIDKHPAIIWTLQRNRRLVTCAVRLESHGIDVDIVRDGQTTVTRTFATEQEALAWAAEKRAEREAEGWASLLPTTASLITRKRTPLA